MRPLLYLAAVLFALTCGPAFATSQQEPPLGLWSHQTRFETGGRETLVLSRQGNRWVARIGTRTAQAIVAGPEIRIAFPNGDALRGTVDRTGMQGFWVRRPVFEDPRYPFGQALAYTTPLRFRSAGPGRWSATVEPLADDFTLYLNIFRDADGSIKAAFRNPEQNSHGGAMRFAVTRDENRLVFAGRRTPAAPEVRLEASLAGDVIRLFWADMDRTIELTPTLVENAARFAPRLPGQPPYAYRRPAPLRDGWRIARARDLGVDESALERTVQRIIDIDPAAERTWPIHSLSIAYKGRLILDEYFYGYGPDEPHDTRSASKTFSSVILGAMMREGSPLSPSSHVYEVMAPLGPFAEPDPRKQRMTLGHLLTHTAGFACDDNAESSPGSEDMIESDRSQPDWTRRTLNLPMAFEPGQRYAYCSMNINLAGAMLSQASGEWLPSLFDRTVARPLEFGQYHWNLQASGEGYLGGGAFVRPRDFLKLGQTYLDGGVWNGRRIADRQWTRDAIAEQARISPETTGVTGDAFNENYHEVGEGWAWHLIEVKGTDRNYAAFHANGNGGQLLLVVPELELVVMFSAGGYGTGLWNRERDELVGKMIIPALQAPTRVAP